jgi:hypothetical protein
MSDPHQPVAQRIEQDDLFLDSAVDSHGFAEFMRDYDIVIDVPALKPDGGGSYIEGRYRYRFTHCVESHAHSTVRPDVWQRSWSDVFIDYAAWEHAGEPGGYLWGSTTRSPTPDCPTSSVQNRRRAGASNSDTRCTTRASKPMRFSSI